MGSIKCIILSFFKCPYKVATGKPCVFCGTSTSFFLAIRGHIKEAFEVNPIGVFLLLFIISVFVIVIARVLVRKLKDIKGGGWYGS